jgi:hypothetical protein
VSTAWIFALLGLGGFCAGLGLAAAVFLVGSQSEERRRA